MVEHNNKKEVNSKNTDNAIYFDFSYAALKLLGKNLYSNAANAISELVANGLDAKAKNVYVYIDMSDKEHSIIEIIDDGIGMNYNDLASKYVWIGRNKRNDEELLEDEKKNVMGRKGIGKLAALYLSNNYYILTKKKGDLIINQYDVVALGELLVDFTDYGMSGQENPVFEANPGGAPCNVLALLRKYNKSCTFIGKIGNDFFGKMLTAILDETGIDHKGLIIDNYYNTTLAFVKNYENGDREFSFYRHPGADMMLSSDEVEYEQIKQSRIFHFGTLSMTDDNVKEATKRAIETAKNNGLIISFDPNLRPPLWKSLDDARNQIAYGLSQCDVLKISDNEIEFMTGTSDFDKGANILMERYPNIKLLNITAGADGSYSYYREIRAYVPSYLLGGTIDTTGAGDTFCGSVLNYLLDHDLENLSKENLIEMLQIANAAAYLVTTKKGAIRSMPDPKDVQKVVNNNYIRED